MRLFVSLVILFVGAAMAYTESETQSMFVDFLRDYSKQYDVEEMFTRYQIFKDNLVFIEQHNKKHALGEVSFTVGINQLADLSHKEYKMMLGYKKNPKRTRKHQESHYHKKGSQFAVPSSVDWRTKGAVNPVKDQGQCGSCWAFSATAAMETAWYFHSSHLLSLSEQLCVDCVNGGQNDCDSGGEMHDCYLQVISEGGDELESAYPYLATSGHPCQFQSSNVVATMSSYRNVTVGDESALMSAAATTVVSVAIDASQQSFQFYTSGVYNEPNCLSCDSLDHGVAVVGYGTDSGKNYWWVRNSWADSWGIAGYIKMSKDMNNQCGIACDATFPVV